MGEKIRLLIADDHPIVRRGLAALIETQDDLEWIGEAEDGDEAVRKALALRPDVTLLDLLMPRLDGIQVIREILRQNPTARILVLTSFYDEEKVFPAIKAGAFGYLLKDSSPQELLRAIREVHRGQVSLHPTVALMVVRELNQGSELPPTEDPLTSRELEVLTLLAKGLSNEEIAARLVISERTVGTHVSNIFSKLHLANRTQAALYALREGLARLEE
ncbi:MAG: DNA-binding response regulator [Chloroflexi bacterium RBG_13_66_10]|nr:MAG: DNA-binding response regulator [Chloroflexi bacterium RBG_13_66_10]